MLAVHQGPPLLRAQQPNLFFKKSLSTPVDYKIRNCRTLQLSADNKIEANSTGVYKSTPLLEAYRSPAPGIT